MGANGLMIGLTAPHSRGWLETLQHSPAIGRLALVDTEMESLDIKGRADARYTDVSQALAAEEPEIALISLPNDQAPAVGLQVLAAGIPTIIEKPVARTAAEVAQLCEVAAQNQAPLATAFLNRCLPTAQEFKRLVEAGALGRITSIEGRMVTSSVKQRNPDHWLFDKGRAGGGILHWLAIHTIDLIRYLSSCEYSALSAQVSTLSGEAIDVEDMAALSFVMDNGALGNLHAGYVLKQRYGDIDLRMRGTMGEIVWPLFDIEGRSDILWVHSDAPGFDTGGVRRIQAPGGEAPGYGGQSGQFYIREFIDAAREKRPFLTDGNDALRALEVVEAAYQSSATGARVQLNRPSSVS